MHGKILFKQTNLIIYNMVNIPSDINGITVEFESSVNKKVVQSLVTGLKHCIKPAIAPGHILSKIYIYSASDSHTSPSKQACTK